MTKLNATGSALLYSTFLGRPRRQQRGRRLRDRRGRQRERLRNRHLQEGFLTALGAFNTPGNQYGAFVAKINTTVGAGRGASSLVYSTRLKATGYVRPYGIAVNGPGTTYVTGFTDAPDYPTTAGALRTMPSAEFRSAFVFKLIPDASIAPAATGPDCSSYSWRHHKPGVRLGQRRGLRDRARGGLQSRSAART